MKDPMRTLLMTALTLSIWSAFGMIAAMAFFPDSVLFPENYAVEMRRGTIAAILLVLLFGSKFVKKEYARN